MTFKNRCNCEETTAVFTDKHWICGKCNTVLEISQCRTGCKTQDHDSYYDCLQSANILIDKSSLKA